jgi:hypothetical protein
MTKKLFELDARGLGIEKRYEIIKNWIDNIEPGVYVDFWSLIALLAIVGYSLEIGLLVAVIAVGYLYVKKPENQIEEENEPFYIKLKFGIDRSVLNLKYPAILEVGNDKDKIHLKYSVLLSSFPILGRKWYEKRWDILTKQLEDIITKESR